MEQRTGDWDNLSRQAWLYLERHTPLPVRLRDGGTLIRVWHYPALEGAHRSWEVVRSRDRYHARRVSWDRDHDSARLHDPMSGLRDGFHPSPTIEVRERDLDAEEATARLATLHAIRFDCSFGHRPTSITLDGAMFGIATRDLRIEWIHEPRDEWRELAAWAAETRAWLDRAVE